jgi:hypothetical protein
MIDTTSFLKNFLLAEARRICGPETNLWVDFYTDNLLIGKGDDFKHARILLRYAEVCDGLHKDVDLIEQRFLAFRDNPAFLSSGNGASPYFTDVPDSRMPGRKVESCNGIGAHFAGVGNERMKALRVFEESGSVHVAVNIDGSEGLQYLDPMQAMAFAKAFERCAIAALKNLAS